MNPFGRVSAVVVNYNGKEFVEECLHSLNKEKSLRELIVVDNGSEDGSLDHLRERFPEVTLIPTGENLGFGRACNVGAQRAQGEFLLLLNYDAELHSGLEEAQKHLKDHPETGLVGGRLVYPDGRLQPSVGRAHAPLRIVLSWLGLSRWFPNCVLLSREVLDPNWYVIPHESVEWVTGALMLIRRSDWELIGGMDPAFFLYVEDVDFCDRLRAMGRRLDYLPTFMAMHRKGGGTNLVSPRALLASVDSYSIYFRKHHRQLTVRVTLAGIGAVFLLRAVIMALQIWRGFSAMIEAKTYLRGALRAFRHSIRRECSWGSPS